MDFHPDSTVDKKLPSGTAISRKNRIIRSGGGGNWRNDVENENEVTCFGVIDKNNDLNGSKQAISNARKGTVVCDQQLRRGELD